jgi:cob(I)alamin adenosyltransferase
MKMYTRSGDDGTTALFGGGRAPKHDARVEACGAVDELNAALGLARALEAQPQTGAWLARVQAQLLTLGADLATPLEAKTARVVRAGAGDVTWLEQTIDIMTGELPPLTRFILPGGTPAAAQIHVARTVCRRAERRAALLAAREAIGPHVLSYLNRLSDFLFTLARWENHQAGVADEVWSAGE